MSKTITIDTINGERTYVLANFWERFGARLLDNLIVILPSQFLPIIVPWLYWSLQQSSDKQATIGQRATGIMVIDTQGQPISFGQATGRFFADLLNLLTFFIGYLLFFGPTNQCLHDRLAGTYVIQAKGYQRENEGLEGIIDA